MKEEGKKEKRSIRIRQIFALLCLAGFLGSGSRLLPCALEYGQGAKEYRNLNVMVREYGARKGERTAGEKEEIPESYLRKINPDYICWLRIPGTAVDYPVAGSSRPGYYLNHTFQGNPNSCGSLFVQEDIKRLENGNTVIFGHNRKDGTMFADLKNYRSADFYKNHPIIRIYYGRKWREGVIFSCQLRGEEDLEYCRTGFSDEAEKQGFINEMKEASLYPIPFNPPVNGPLITLSTCYGRTKRMIVQAVLM
ncbi:class B sortase [Lachnospiraceae bacterium 54-53]